jgi:hypothetical protein
VATTLPPLPLPARLYGGETVDSYATRLSTLNHSDVTTIEMALREQDRLPKRTPGYDGRPKARHYNERAQVWRELGGLHEWAFTTPELQEGKFITQRDLCLRCCQGQPATGTLPFVGLVCLKHKRWLGTSQCDLRSFPPALTAERHFRNTLASRGVLFNSIPMRIGAACASVGVSGQLLADRRRMTGLGDRAALTYPEQVSFARLFCQPSFIAAVLHPVADPCHRRAIIERFVSAILPTEDEGAARVGSRIWTVAADIDQMRANHPWEASAYVISSFALFKSFLPADWRPQD